jgi:hypothetical protein
MLYFLFVWNLLAIICGVIGFYILHLLRADCFDRTGDRIIISIWSGLVLLSIALLAVSFALPLSPLVGLSTAVFLMLPALLSAPVWRELNQLSSAFSNRCLGMILALELWVAALINRPMEWFDSGGYHVGIIRWLAEVGTVPGLALLNYGYGFTSAWFALTAPLAPAGLGHHLGAVANGFAFLLAGLQVVVSLSYFQKQDFRVIDGFAIAVYASIGAIYSVTIFTGSPILISFSPDVPITLLIAVTAWSLLAIKSADQTLQGIDRSNQLDTKILPLLLGVGAVSFKLSALPALVIVVVFYAVEARFSLKKLLIGASLLILLLTPMLGYGVMTSACPFFPSTTVCVDLPWRFPEDEANHLLRESKVLNLHESANSSNTVSNFAQRLSWLKTQRKMQIMLLFYALSIALSLNGMVSGFVRRKAESGAIWVMGIGLLGSTFIVFYAPLIRFGLIYFLLIPALFLAQKLTCRLNAGVNRLRSPFSLLLYQGAIALLCLSTVILSPDWRNLVSLVPPALPQPKVIQAQTHDIEYVYPADWTYQCWATPLPCAIVPLKQVRLRNPQQGIGAGFVTAH